MKPLNKLFILTALLLLGACAQPPKPLRGDFNNITPTQYVNNPRTNLNIRWTGFVSSVENHENHSCLNVVGKVADSYAKPSRNVRIGTGRFVACKAQFLDPELFNKKPVTVVGQAKKVIEKKVSEHLLPQPLVDAEVIYVW